MSNPRNDSSKARKSAAKASQSTSTKSAHEVLDELIAENEAQKLAIKLLAEENNKLAYTIGSRDLEIHDLQEQVADLTKCSTLFSKALQDLGKYNAQLVTENGRLVTIHNELGRDYTALQTQNKTLAEGVVSASKKVVESECVVQSQRKIIGNIKQMLSLQQQIMSDVAGLK